MAKKCYILSAAQVSCQKPLSEDWYNNPIACESDYVRAIEPDSKSFIPVGEARRMSKLLKRAICTSISALKASGIEHPDAIITGTGMGCIENSEKFLTDMEKYGENMLKPTLFMQSTHNTISSLIGINLKCHGYNSTYSHRGVSFENALWDAWLQIKQGAISNALVGSHDEVTPLVAKILKQTNSDYRFISETSVSFMIASEDLTGNGVEISDVQILNEPTAEELKNILNSATPSLVICGTNGNPINDEPYNSVIDGKYPVVGYRNLFGNNYSSSALGTYVGFVILQRQSVPEHLAKDIEYPSKINRMVILNHTGELWSIITLQKDE